MDNNTIEKLKDIELEILIHIDKLCKQHNLKYYLVGGTLLGAIRHKGFIPWDDDIDIGMMRDDYNKLIQILIEEKSNKYFVQNFNTDPEYPRYITKVRVNGTQFMEGHLENYNMHHGIFIDIFPLDKIKEKNEKKLDFRVNFTNKILTLRTVRNNHTEHLSKNKKILAKIIRPLTFLLPLSFYNKLIDYIYEYENDKDCKYVTNFGSQYGWRKQTFPIDVYGEGTYLEFEGHQFMAPAKWEVILKSLYGDYMKLPPEEKRNSGHDVVHIDLGKYAEN
ncbi:lipopolysaccharide cholinephosphotransferase [Desulfitispora alkaliphila]|uniref:LicD family protein n=1 Tax=Desulfitispora alkaliphila TaxID=622674 RepID=UPI003D1CDD4F